MATAFSFQDTGIRDTGHRLPPIAAMKDADLSTVDRDVLVDIRDVKVNTELPKTERALDFIRQIGNPYCYRHGRYVVKVGFSDTDVSLEERLAGYIRSKC